MSFKIFRSFSLLIFFLYPLLLIADQKCLEQGEKEKKEEKMLSILKYYELELEKEPNNSKLLGAIGDAYYSLRRFPEAISAYEKMLLLTPNDNSVKINLANSYLSNGNESKSRALFLQVLNSDPKNSQALAGIGRLEALLGHFNDAEQLYKHSLTIDPENSTALFYQAELYIDKKQYQEAQTILNNLLKKKPAAEWIEDALRRAELGPTIDNLKSIEEGGNLASALQQYSSLLEKNPDVVELYILLAQVYDKMGNGLKAKEILEQGLNRFPASDRLKLALGYSYILSHEYQKAEKIFTDISQRAFLKADSFAALGRIYTLKGNFTKADQYFQEALKNKPDHILTLSYLAEMAMDQEDYKSAKKYYQQILTIQPDLKFAQEALLSLNFLPFQKEIQQKIKARDFKGAEQDYQDLIAKQPANPLIYEKIGQFYEEIRQYENAIKIYAQGLSIFPENESLLKGLANAYFKNGNFEQSRDLFLKITAQYPSNMDALIGLGKSTSALGDFEKAKNYYAQVLEMNPANQEALGDLGVLYLKNKDYADAEKIFNQILELSPQKEWVNQSLIRAELGEQFDKVLDLEKSKQYHEAIELTKNLLNQNPKSIDLYLLLGRLYEEEKNYKKAIDTYYLGLSLLPNEMQLRIALSFALIEENELDNAKRLLDFILLEDPFNAEALLGLGRIALLQGEEKKSQEYFQQAYALDPKNITILSYLANFYTANQQFDKAQKYYKIIIKHYPQATWAKELLKQAELGPALQEIQTKKEAYDDDAVQALYEKLIQKQEDKLALILQYGQFLVSIQEYDKAEVLYTEGMQLYPHSKELVDALGFLYLARGDFKTAEEIFHKNLIKNPEDSEALAGLGKAAEMAKNDELAEEYYIKALELDPRNLSALSFLGPLEEKEGNFEEAKEYYQKILQIDPKATWAKKALKNTRFAPLLEQIKEKQLANDTKGVQDLFRQLIIESCGDPEYFYQLGNFYQRSKKYELAIDTYQQGLAIAPKSDLLWASVGLSYISEKKWPKAQEAFEKSLHLNPLNADALAGLGNVKTEINELQEANALIKKSLKIDSHNPLTLSALGILKMKEKKYTEAASAFKKIMALDPKAEWANVLYENAINGKKIEELEEEFKKKNFHAAADGYEALATKYPENPGYFFGMGLAYLRLQEYGSAESAFKQGYQLHPDENELLVSFGYAVLFQERYDEAEQLLMRALQKDPKNAEAIAGLGRINALRENFCYAEDLFLKAMEIEPKNQSALTFYGDLLMKEKRYKEAYEIFLKVKALLKEDEKWIEEALQDARDGPLTDAALLISNQEQFELAACLYKQLIDNYPQSPIRYYPLGQTYLDLFKPCKAICIFKLGLEIDEKRAPLWRGIAAAYIDMEYYGCALAILTILLENDPKDADSWALVGRIEALTGSYQLAECYLLHALSLSPENTKGLSYLADLYTEEQYFFSAIDRYYQLRMKNCCTKWIKRGFKYLQSETRPTIILRGFIHDEYEWATNLGIWAAKYEVIGGEVKFRYPICDTLYSEFIVNDSFYNLRDLEFGTLLYSIEAGRVRVRGKQVQNTNWFYEAGLEITIYSRFYRGSFDVRGGIILSPEFKITYHRPREKFTIGILSNSDLIARNFNTQEAKLVGIYALDTTYEKKICRRTWVGLEGMLAYYAGYGGNGYGMALAWTKWRPECCPENWSLNYRFKMASFTNNIPDYYTYYAQLVNYFEVKYEKFWRVLWADTLFTSVSLGVGEQNTYTRYQQIIVVNPTPGTPPLSWDNRTYGFLGGKIEHTCDCIKSGLSADLYRDTEKYTIWNLEAFIQYTF